MEKLEIVTGAIRGGDVNGTYLCGEICAAYSDLVKVLGEPTYKYCKRSSLSDNKTSTEWIVTFKGKTFTIYDYKATTLYYGSKNKDILTPKELRALPSYTWHVGSTGDASKFITAIKKAIKKNKYRCM